MTEFEVNPASDVPLWVQLRQRIIYLISVGDFNPGDQLPSVRGLAAEISINYNTVSKAYISLERDGYIECTRKGTFVKDCIMEGEEQGPTEALAEEYINTCLDEGMLFPDIRKQFNSVIRRMQHKRDGLMDSISVID